MTPLESQLSRLRQLQPAAATEEVSTGGTLILLPDYQMPAGWDLPKATILFLAPPGYPAAQPDCFWIEPGPVRFGGGQTPQASNDSNPIPGVGSRGTWFSWHLQQWDPNHDSLVTYFHVIEQRLKPAR